LPRIYQELAPHGVRWLCDERSLALLAGRPKIAAAPAGTFDVEHLDLVLSCAVVDGLEQALAHIEAHGSRHSECIVTASGATAEEFLARVDAAATYWNASTRFTDGFELGLGGELGISTQKLHARGPVGLRELTSARWLMRGTGQTRA
jgi:glutamate-5-semialdehyde dehydrogenase